MRLKELRNKKILILGLGQEGMSSFLFLRKLFPEMKIGLADKLPLKQLNKETRKKISADKDIDLHLGKNYLNALDQYQVIIKSPGIPLFLPQLKKVKSKITSQTKIFFENCPGRIIGITGTKGKSTTASLTYQILKEGGLDVSLVGNIGNPALSLLLKARKKMIFVYELSSHQLYDLEKSPNIAVLLNIFREHLDYYQNFEQYVQAKEKITLFQTKEDYFIYNPSLDFPRRIAQKTKAQKLHFSLRDYHQPSCFLKNQAIFYRSNSQEEKIVETKAINLEGEFNLLNIMAATTIGKLFNIPNRKIVKAIKKFKPLEHRLERIGTYREITFYNDSLSTIPEATIKAIDALADKVGTIILGGYERNQNYNQLARKILDNQIKTIILFPTTGERIWQTINKQKAKGDSLPKHFFTNNMEEAVHLAYKHTPKGEICLLSPAAPSFNLFKDYKERGSLFKKFVETFAKS